MKSKTIIYALLLIGLCGCHSVANTPSPTSTDTPIPTPTVTPQWMMYESALLKATVRKADGACEWTILGKTDTEVYVYTLCQLRGPIGTAMSVPAVIYLGENGDILEVTIPRDGVFYPQDIKALFPIDIQRKIFSHDFGEILKTNDPEHLQARLNTNDRDMAPLIAVLGTPMP